MKTGYRYLKELVVLLWVLCILSAVPVSRASRPRIAGRPVPSGAEGMSATRPNPTALAPAPPARNEAGANAEEEADTDPTSSSQAFHAQFFVSNQSLTGIFVIGIIISDFIWA